MTTAHKFIGGVVLALLAFIGGMAVRGVTGEMFAGGAINALPGLFPNGIKVGDVNEQWVTTTLSYGQDQVSILNTTGRDLIVDYAEVQTIADHRGNATASSTYDLAVFATSTTNVPNSHDFTPLAFDKYQLIRATFATSTTATTTNSVGSTRTGGQGAIRWPADWSLTVYLNRATNGACKAGTCETATSTNRGFDLKLRTHYHFED